MHKILHRPKVLFLAAALPVLVVAGIVGYTPQRAEAACAVPSPNYGVTSYTVSVPATGSYRIWSRIMAADATNNSYMLEIDGNACYTIADTANMSASAWTWVDYQAATASNKITPSLTAGQHTVKVIGREPSVKVDRIMALSDLSCVPSGMGDNCTVATDTKTPTVAITSPADNTTMTGNFTVSATATDDTAVSKVEFYVDNSLESTMTAAPYKYTVDTAALANGSHTVLVKAYDQAGNIGSDTVIFTIKNGDTTKPTTPSELKLASNSANKVALTWKASTDNVGVSGYTIKRDGVTIGTSATAAYTDTTAAAGQTYSYSVVAYDQAGNTSAASTPLSVTVPKPADAQAPTVPTALSATAVGTSQINIAWKASTDNVGVAAYDIYRATTGNDATKVATVSTVSYGDTGLKANTTYAYYVIARDANNNSSVKSATVDAKTAPAPTVPTDPGQQQGLGTIRGKVTGKRNRPLAEAKVIVTSDAKRYTATTNKDGIYRIEGVVTGRYDINFRADGYQREEDRVRVREGKSTVNNVRLYEQGRRVQWWNRWW